MVSEQDFQAAKEAAEVQRRRAHATAARYDRKSERLIVSLHNGIELAVPVELVEGLAGRDAESLSHIEITPSGLGLHWPALDADVHVGALLAGVFGSRSWMAEQLGASGGRKSSAAKSAAARRNGQRGGRPRRQG